MRLLTFWIALTCLCEACDWGETDAGPYDRVSLVDGGGRFLGTVENATGGFDALFSDDGVTVTRTTITPLGLPWVRGVAIAPDRILVWTHDASAEAVSDESLYESTDRATFHPIPIPPGLETIVFGNGVFVAITDPRSPPRRLRSMLRSLDGNAWQDLGTVTEGALAFAGGRFILVGGDGTLRASSDAIAWTEIRPRSPTASGFEAYLAVTSATVGTDAVLFASLAETNVDLFVDAKSRLRTSYPVRRVVVRIVVPATGPPMIDVAADLSDPWPGPMVTIDGEVCLVETTGLLCTSDPRSGTFAAPSGIADSWGAAWSGDHLLLQRRDGLWSRSPDGSLSAVSIESPPM